MSTPYTPYPAAPAGRPLSIVSLVLGLSSIVLGFTFIVPILAVIFGFIARGKEPAGRTLALWGIISGFVMLAGWIILLVVVAVFLPLLLVGLSI